MNLTSSEGLRQDDRILGENREELNHVTMIVLVTWRGAEPRAEIRP